MDARIGRGGWRVGAGRYLGGTIIRAELLGTVLRTNEDPRHAAPHATYVGAEGAFVAPVALLGRRFVGLRTSIGFVARTTGPSGRRAGFDGSLSLQVPLAVRGW